MIRDNLRPLTFIDVPRDEYLAATLALYETARFDPMRDLYEWAYERSRARYETITDAIEDPDPFRLVHRNLLYECVRAIVAAGESDPETSVERFAAERFENRGELAKFVGLVLSDLDSLHEGNYMRYRITPGQFEAWISR